MSKKSYKRHQNRLYREIKRRLIAEEQMRHSLNIDFKAYDHKIDTLKIKNIVPNYVLIEHEEFVKQDMARMLTNKLLREGYIQFCSQKDPPYFPIDTEIEIEAKMMVVRPDKLNCVG